MKIQEFKNSDKLMEDVRLIKSVINECFTIKDIQDKTKLNTSRIQRIMNDFNLSPSKKRFCLECSKELRHSGNRPPKFCSSKCKDKWTYRNKTSFCVVCSKEINGDKKYCSESCRNSVGVKCVKCGTFFISNSNMKYCERCKHEMEVERVTSTETRSCVICDKNFKDNKNSKNITCSLTCRRKYITLNLRDKVLMSVYSSTDPEVIKLETKEKIKWIDA